MTGQGGSGSTIYQDILQYPVDIDYGDLKDYDNIYNSCDTLCARAPWWRPDHNCVTSQGDCVYGNIEPGFRLFKGLPAGRVISALQIQTNRLDLR